MEFRSSYNFRQLFHVCWLDVYNVEALILDVQIPKIDSKVITANESLAIAIDRNTVDVISMSICIGFARYGSHNRIMVSETREFEIGCCPEMHVWVSHWTASARNTSSRSLFMRQIVLSDDL
jgi:hypothetical protein